MRFIEEIEGLVSSKFAEIKAFISMAKLEAVLAALSVFPLLISLCLILVVLMTTWLSAMLLIGGLIIWLNGNVLFALAFIIFSNIIILGVLFRYLWFNLKNMSFEATRHYLNSISTQRTHDGNDLKKESDTGNPHPGKTID